MKMLTPKGQSSVDWTIENPGRFLWSQFKTNVHEILTQDVNIYPLNGNMIFFYWVHKSKVMLPWILLAARAFFAF